MANNNSDKLTKGMRDGGSYKEPVWEGTGVPGEGAEGFTKYPVGNQDNAGAPAGEEGAHAAETIVANGNVESHSSYSSLDSAPISGFEK